MILTYNELIKKHEKGICKSWVESPRWGHIEGALIDWAQEVNVDITISHVEKYLIRERVFFEICGTEKKINRFMNGLRN